MQKPLARQAHVLPAILAEERQDLEGYGLWQVEEHPGRRYVLGKLSFALNAISTRKGRYCHVTYAIVQQQPLSGGISGFAATAQLLIAALVPEGHNHKVGVQSGVQARLSNPDRIYQCLLDIQRRPSPVCGGTLYLWGRHKVTHHSKLS